MKKVSCFLVGMTIVFCCSQNKELAQNENADLDSFQTYTIDIHKEAIPYYELIDHVEVVQLEETPEAQVGNVTLVSTNDSSIVIVNYKQDFLFVYSSEGRFISKINRQGSGPEEYSYIGDIWLKHNTVTFYDRRKRRIFSYDLVGNFKNSTDKINENATHLFPIDNGYVLDTDYGLIADTLKARLLFLDRDLLPVATALPFSHPVGFSVFDGFNVFQYDGKHVAYQTYLSDTIYKLVGHKAEPHFSIDVGEDWFWNHYSVFDDPTMVYNKMQTSEMPSRLMISSGLEHLYVKALVGSKGPHFIVNRNSHEYDRVDYGKHKIAPKNPLTTKDGKFLFLISSDVIREFLSPLKADQSDFVGGNSLEQIESSENPVLVWVKFK